MIAIRRLLDLVIAALPSAGRWTICVDNLVGKN
jgi:hypothetical protein